LESFVVEKKHGAMQKKKEKKEKKRSWKNGYKKMSRVLKTMGT
jgi:hypothetical protein